MMKTARGTGVFLSKGEIIRIKTKALRKGVWYKALNGIERACVDLVIKIVRNIRSPSLRKMLLSVIKKLEEAMTSPIHQLLNHVGKGQAEKLSQIAQSWGNKFAGEWAKDEGFKLYLAITYLNASR